MKRFLRGQYQSKRRDALPSRTLLTAHRSPLTFILLLLLTAHCTLHTASAAWSKQRTASLAWLHAVFFVDQNRGWAVGSRGTLLATSDGGQSWQARPQPTEDVVRDIYFTDDQNGWLVCERNIYELQSNNDQRAYLMKTSDGGEHWQRVNMRGAAVDTRVSRVIFNRRGHGWAFGESGVVYATRDSGMSWTRLQAPTRFLLLGGAFVDESNGWLVGAGSTILQTMNGGETWHHGRLATSANATQITNSVATRASNSSSTLRASARASTGVTSIRFNSVSFVDSRLGWAVGSGGSIYRTLNGGASWQPQSSGVTADLLDVKFLDALEGWAVGDEGTVLHTTDGGRHWSNEHSPTPHALERIFFTDRNHGWAVGFGGTIISYGTSPGAAEPPKLKP